MRTHYLDLFLEFVFSMRWVWLLVVIFIYRLLRIVAVGWAERLTIESDKILRDTNYKEEEIINHLDYIIKEALDEYNLLQLVPKDIQYINTKMEQQILEYLSEEIPKRVSKTLLTHLSFIYDSDYLGDFLGKRIYMSVVNFRLNYNTSQPEAPKNNSP